MRSFQTLIDFSKAKAIAMAAVSPMERTESIELGEAAGRVLAVEVRAPQDVPSFARAAMDGYALIAAETASAESSTPAVLTCQETVHAGCLPTRPLDPGHCTRIATGAMVPQGADAVVMVEDAEREGEKVFVYRPVQPGQYISPAGHDLNVGEVVVAPESLLTPARLGALATVGCRTVTVYAKPRVAIIPTGDEVVHLDRPLKPGQVYNTNTYTLAGAVTRFGALPILHPEIVTDDWNRLRRAIESHPDCDVIVVSGGSSVGERDVVPDVFSEMGQILFHGVAVKPGKPTILASNGNQLLLGMPGFPTSCLSNAYVLLGPMLLKMARLPAREQTVVRLPLASLVCSELGRHQFYSVRIADGQVYPTFKGSGAITSMSEADGYIEIPAGVDHVEKGELVDVHFF